MSRIFTILTSNTYNDPLQAIDAVINKDIKSINLYIGSLNFIKDIQNSNLLHLATLNEHNEMVKYLLDNKVDKTHKNKFGLTPWDYAIRSHNKELIKIYIDHDLYNFDLLKIQNENLQKINSSLAIENRNLTENNKKLISEKDTQQNEITILKKNNKRLREQNNNLELKIGTLTSERDHLVNENDGLVYENKKLKISVDSLTKAMRK